MRNLGFTLSAEEHAGSYLVQLGRRAEAAGFDFLMISDHFHPWIDKQGHSPFVWSVIGGLAQSTQRVRIGTGVTCPTIRIHPAIIAQAAATAGEMTEGRFFLGVGSGENLNEHVLGDRWPAAAERLGMLDEAIEVIRHLWKGGSKSHRGQYYTVENARIYTLPKKPPEIMVAAAGDKAIELAARKGDGLIATAPDRDTIETFAAEGGEDKPRFGQVHVCWAQDESAAVNTAYEWWPNAALKGELGQELPLPRHFEQAAENLDSSDVAEAVVCGPDPERHREAINSFFDAGFDHVWVHQVGPDQEGMLAFYESEILPKLR
jgi:coenzyme F420-dependent glucose-6-phosphate dehydrogenase